MPTAAVNRESEKKEHPSRRDFTRRAKVLFCCVLFTFSRYNFTALNRTLFPYTTLRTSEVLL